MKKILKQVLLRFLDSYGTLKNLINHNVFFGWCVTFLKGCVENIVFVLYGFTLGCSLFLGYIVYVLGFLITTIKNALLQIRYSTLLTTQLVVALFFVYLFLLHMTLKGYYYGFLILGYVYIIIHLLGLEFTNICKEYSVDNDKQVISRVIIIVLKLILVTLFIYEFLFWIVSNYPGSGSGLGSLMADLPLNELTKASIFCFVNYNLASGEAKYKFDFDNDIRNKIQNLQEPHLPLEPYTYIDFKSEPHTYFHIANSNSIAGPVADSENLLGIKNPGYISFPVNSDFLPKDLTTSLITNITLTLALNPMN